MKNYIFKTNRLGFRTWQDADNEPFVALNKNEKVMEYFPDVLPEQETMAMIERIKTHFADYGYGLWAVDELETEQFIGFIGLSHPRFDSFFTPCVEIGWRLNNKFWGKGYATEGAEACLKYAFEVLHLPKVYSFAPMLNKRSEQVMKNIGMEKIGEFHHPNLLNHFLSLCVIYEIENPNHHEPS